MIQLSYDLMLYFSLCPLSLSFILSRHRSPCPLSFPLPYSYSLTCTGSVNNLLALAIELIKGILGHSRTNALDPLVHLCLCVCLDSIRRVTTYSEKGEGGVVKKRLKRTIGRVCQRGILGL